MIFRRKLFKQSVLVSNQSLVFGLVLALSSLTAIADSCTNCTVRSIGIGPYYDEICNKSCAFIAMNEPVIGNQTDGCRTSDSWHFVLDTSTESGKNALSALLTAYVAKQPVTIEGKNNICTLFSGSEDFNAMYFPFN